MTAKRSHNHDVDSSEMEQYMDSDGGPESPHHRCVQHGILRAMIGGMEKSSGRKWWAIGGIGGLCLSLFVLVTEDNRSSRAELLQRMDAIQSSMQSQFMELKLEVRELQILMRKSGSPGTSLSPGGSSASTSSDSGERS